MLVVHHLGISQSERIPWVCEELGVPYEMVKYDRDPKTRAAPAEYKKLDFFGAAPVIQDGDLTMGESGAIVEYICRKYAGGRLFVGPEASNFPAFLYWFHFGNGTFMPSAMMALAAAFAGGGTEEMNRMRRIRYERSFEMAEKRLGEVPCFAGKDFTAADIMMLFPMTRMREFLPHDISGCPNILAYLQRIGARPAFQRAMTKGDPNLPPKLT